MDDASGGHSAAPGTGGIWGTGFLGFTTREAYAALGYITVTLEDVDYHNKYFSD